MTEKLKVLFLIHTLGGGGAEKVLVDVANRLDKDKFDVTVQTVVDTGVYKGKLDPSVKYKTIFPFPSFLKAKSGKGSGKESGSGSLLDGKIGVAKKVAIALYSMFWRRANLSTLSKRWIGDEYDVEVSFLEGICAKIIRASQNKSATKIAWIHVDLQEQRKSEKVFSGWGEERETYKAFDKIAFVSSYVKEKFEEKYHFADDEIGARVLYNPIFYDEVKRKSEEYEVEWRKEAPSAIHLINVGRLNAQKSHIRLLKAVSRLAQDGFDFVLHIVGEGTHEEELRQYVSENGIEDRVVFHGYVSNPYPLMKNADLYVCSSLTEGLSTTVLESLCLGLPVVTTDCAGMSEILDDGKYGLIVPNSEEGIYEGVRYAMKSPSALKQLKNMALRKNMKEADRVAMENISAFLSE